MPDPDPSPPHELDLDASGPSGLSGLGSASGRSSQQSAQDKSGRQTFGAEELAVVLSHYDLGVIDLIQAYPRGSRKAPKLVLRTENGLYLLKRRAKSKADKRKAVFCHAVQRHLAAQQFPLPHLIETRDQQQTMLRHDGRIYELFEYLKGTPYDQSLTATQDAGQTLGLLHKLMRTYTPPHDPPGGSYHDARSVHNAFCVLPSTLADLHPDQPPEQAQRISQLNRLLNTMYLDAVKRVQDAGLDGWPQQVVHGDWHPGNILFRGNRVRAVVDYDAARQHQRVIDAANGALQFSIIGGGDDPSQWPDYLDESRFKRFLRGYDSVPDNVLSRAELHVIPWLMIQALIAESVIPIAATGYFSRMEGLVFLEMVERKVLWLQGRADALATAIED